MLHHDALVPSYTTIISLAFPRQTGVAKVNYVGRLVGCMLDIILIGSFACKLRRDIPHKYTLGGCGSKVYGLTMPTQARSGPQPIPPRSTLVVEQRIDRT